MPLPGAYGLAPGYGGALARSSPYGAPTPQEHSASQDGAAPRPASQLPEGWQEGIDPASGKRFYYNSVTGETKRTLLSLLVKEAERSGAGGLTLPGN